MKLGIIVLSIGNFGKKGYYNLQEVGLAKELDKLCEQVKVYKLVSRDQTYLEDKIEGTQHATITYLPSKKLGTNGIPNVKFLDKSMDAYICFSDTQLMFPRIYKWTKKNQIKVFPYIGVTESHSSNQIKENIINGLFKRNLNCYKHCVCFAKTPSVELSLKQKGVANVSVIPVGLDITLTKTGYEKYDKALLKKKYEFESQNKIILFVGRMIEEKHPIDMITIFSQLVDENTDYRLLMVGTGPLKNDVEKRIEELDIGKHVKLLERISNSDIWELYHMSDSFVNLNQQEIFGMAILEAMYYGCKVVAMEAPGPGFIIENGISGYLVKNATEVVQAIKQGILKENNSRRRIENEFTWQSSAEKIMKIIAE